MKRTTFKILRLAETKDAEYTAAKLGVSICTYRKYEQSTLLPSAIVLSKMADVYGCDYNEVMRAYNCHRQEYESKNN